MIALPLITFLNGPPGSGKSTLASLLCETNPNAFRESFANPIREMIYSVFFPEEGPIGFSFDLRNTEQKKKEFPFYLHNHPRNIGAPRHTFRDAMISFSEDWMKPAFGPDIFGRLALARVQVQMPFYSYFVFDDCGFEPELKPIVDEFGAHRCQLIRLHREGTTFASDSRGYVTPSFCPSFDLDNNASPEAMLTTLQLKAM